MVVLIYAFILIVSIGIVKDIVAIYLPPSKCPVITSSRRCTARLASERNAWPIFWLMWPMLGEQLIRNREKVGKVLFEEIRLGSGGKVVAVKPRPELEAFFGLSCECHARDIAGDPGGI